MQVYGWEMNNSYVTYGDPLCGIILIGFVLLGLGVGYNLLWAMISGSVILGILFISLAYSYCKYIKQNKKTVVNTAPEVINTGDEVKLNFKNLRY